LKQLARNGIGEGNFTSENKKHKRDLLFAHHAKRGENPNKISNFRKFKNAEAVTSVGQKAKT
jgi:hypothetical protein